jgi:phosphoribosylformylglycinamidine cyclo-ligase
MAGFAVGLVDNADIIDGSTIHVGDEIIGLASSGLHSNGYSLVRRIVFDQLKLQPDSLLGDCNRTAAEELLEPTRIYVEPIMKILKSFRIAGMAHITGGGFYDNIPRILPRACQAVIFRNNWEVPPVFRFLQEHGAVSDEEIYRVFNCGIGFVLVVDPAESGDIIDLLNGMGQRAFRIGEIAPRTRNDAPIQVVAS